jgi:hypothetical protein
MCCSDIPWRLKTYALLQAALAAVTHLAEGLTLVQCTVTYTVLSLINGVSAH